MSTNSDVRVNSSVELATNKVLKNTYRLLSMTLLFAGFVAFLANFFNWPHPMVFFGSITGMPFAGMLMVLAIWYGLLFMIRKNQNSIAAIGWVFAFAGFTGYMAGALINIYVSQLSNGYDIVAGSLIGTGIVFLGSSFLCP